MSEPLAVSWEEKRKEYPQIVGDESILAQAWNLGEDLLFFYVMFLASF